MGFTQQGLPKHDTELTQKSKDWFEQNGDLVVKYLHAAKEAMKDTESPEGLNNYRKVMSLKHSLLDRYCKECNIKDD